MQRPKTFRNPKIVDIKSVILEHPKNSHKLSKTIRKTEKVSQVGSNSSLYSDTKKSDNFVNEKNLRKKQADAFKGHVSSYNIEILNSFNTELQLKYTESAIKNKLIKFLSGLRGFKFVTILVLVLKKIESNDNTKYDIFYSHSKAETIINESDIDDNVFKSFYTTLVSNIQKSRGKGSLILLSSGS